MKKYILFLLFISTSSFCQEKEIKTLLNGDEAIVLTSTFDVDGSGGDGSLNPNSTYKDWIWLLVRNKQGEWKHVDHGY